MLSAIAEALVMMLGAALLGALIVYLLLRNRYLQLSEIQKQQEKQLQQAQEQARHFLRLDQELHTARNQYDQLSLEMDACKEARLKLEKKLDAAEQAAQAIPKAPVEPPAKPDTSDKEAVLARIKEKASGLDFATIGIAAKEDRDDLKRIKGIGPFIEEKLNALGIFTFRQIANFTEEIEQQVNEAIEFFSGRIRRDNWKGQAEIFAREKEAEK